MAQLGFYHDYSLFTLLWQVFMLKYVTTGILRESAHGRGTRENRSPINFGSVWVQTLAACVPGECFIHFAMPLELVTKNTSMSLTKYYHQVINSKRRHFRVSHLKFMQPLHFWDQNAELSWGRGYLVKKAVEVLNKRLISLMLMLMESRGMKLKTRNTEKLKRFKNRVLPESLNDVTIFKIL